MRPASGVRWPATRLNSVDFPAPFGPRMPSASPSWSERLRPSTAFSAPNDRVMPSSLSSSPIEPSRDRLQLVGDRNRRRLGIVDDHQLVLVLAAASPPLAAGERRLGDILEGRQLAELDPA